MAEPDWSGLHIAITASAAVDAVSVADSWRSHGDANVQVDVVDWPPSLADAAAHELVVGTGEGSGPPGALDSIDVWSSRSDVSSLWRDRILPFRDNLAANRRAPRRQTVEHAVPDPAWPVQARRLIARLQRVLGDGALRIDHIGSTSVPGLPAKDLVDIQVVVADLDVADAASVRARSAGFVRVPGRWTGLDRTGVEFEEIVIVDADPGRPVNVNLRPVGEPVWRATLLFRDWLRADAANRDAYLAFKQHLAETTSNVDDYSAGKRSWIGEALGAASRWADETGWNPDT